jgi:protein-S-isoprenylcysteine O-methyltransferase Ste14
MTIVAAKLIWLFGVVAWFVMRQVLVRGSHRIKMRDKRIGWLEGVLLLASLLGLFVVPMIYAASGKPAFADHTLNPALAWLGVLTFAAALWLFYRTHKDLGTNWSITLVVREQHSLVTNGVYAHVRHPMYAAFWLWALAQFLLLPNWIAGAAGLVGFGVLFFGRVRAEERMLIDHFGNDYRRYMARTARIIPGLY